MSFPRFVWNKDFNSNHCGWRCRSKRSQWLGVLFDGSASALMRAVVTRNAGVAKSEMSDLQTMLSAGQEWRVERKLHVL